MARLNEGDAFDLPSGIFTVPVPGIYHFDVSARKYFSSNFLRISLQVNGLTVGSAYTEQSAPASHDVVSLSASLRLAAGDRVNLYNFDGGMLYDSLNHYTHFSGWLVEEDLMLTEFQYLRRFHEINATNKNKNKKSNFRIFDLLFFFELVWAFNLELANNL